MSWKNKLSLHCTVKRRSSEKYKLTRTDAEYSSRKTLNIDIHIKYKRNKDNKKILSEKSYIKR